MRYLFLYEFLEVRAKNKALDYFGQLESLLFDISNRECIKIRYSVISINNLSMRHCFSGNPYLNADAFHEQTLPMSDTL